MGENRPELLYRQALPAYGTCAAIIATTEADSVITVRNPAGNAAALSITPPAGGASPVSAHLVIVQLQSPIFPIRNDARPPDILTGVL